MLKVFNQVTGRISLGAASCLMFGAFLAVWQRALDTVAGRTVYTSTVFVSVVFLGFAAGLVGAGGRAVKVKNRWFYCVLFFYSGRAGWCFSLWQ